MKTSLVLTTYNGENYIFEQLESIRCQSRQLDEVLIFDDRSTDNTIEILKDFIQKNNLVNWRYIKNETNKGWRRNFMDGLSIASGDIIFLSDQDDIWMHEKIELMASTMEMNPSIKLLVCDYQPFFKIVPVVKKNSNNTPIRKKLYPNIFNVLYPGCTYCVKRQFFHEAKQYWTEDTAHDELLWRTALFSEGLYIYPQKLIYWRQHQDSSWALEGAKNKTLEVRLKWTEFAQRQIGIVCAFLNNHGGVSQKKEHILTDNLEWIKLRKKLFLKKRICTCLQLLKYIDYYNSFKQYLGDIYITFLK